MKRIIIFIPKIISRNPDKFNCRVIGHIDSNVGALDISAVAEFRDFIEQALAKALNRGVYAHWGKLEESLIMEYERKLEPTDPKFLDHLAEQLFDGDQKIDGQIVMALPHAKFKRTF